MGWMEGEREGEKEDVCAFFMTDEIHYDVKNAIQISRLLVVG